MFSLSKKLDKEYALDLIGMIEVLIKRGKRLNNKESLDLAEQYGEIYLANELQMQVKDYGYEDRFQELWLETNYENSI